MHTNALEEFVILVISYIVPIVEACGAAVIVMGVIRAIIHHLRCGLRLDLECLDDLRLVLVESLIMGLEFQLAADVLKTAISPTWNQVLVLAALVGLRIALSVVLERELHTICHTPATTAGQSSEHLPKKA